MTLEPINAGSVVDIAYQRIRTLIEDGELGPNARLRQGDLEHWAREVDAERDGDEAGT
jgi:hypothetical protein